MSIESLKNFYRFLFRNGVGTPSWKAKFESFGDNSTIAYPILSINPWNVNIGVNTKILKFARLQNFISQSENNPRIIIGDRCYIGFFFTILNGSTV